MKRVEIKWEEVHEFFNTCLVAGGFDLAKETRTFCKWEDGKVTFVWEQEEDATYTETAKIQQQRPEYLR
jgi:hypothetical protein